jgi:hypothetical protein
MALQPFVGPWPLFQFPNPTLCQYESLDVGSARRKAATYTQNKHTQTSMPWAEFEPTIPVFERAKTIDDSDHAASVSGMKGN